jgi:hypothetical protein
MGKVCPLQLGRKGVLSARANREGSPGIAFLSAACFLAIHPQGDLGRLAEQMCCTYLQQVDGDSYRTVEDN